MPAPYYAYIRTQWILGQVDSVFVEYQVTKNRLTRAEADAIMALPQPAPLQEPETMVE